MLECPKCGGMLSIKDTGVYSSLLCDCRIIIYYYELGNVVEIPKEEYLRWKKKK